MNFLDCQRKAILWAHTKHPVPSLALTQMCKRRGELSPSLLFVHIYSTDDGNAAGERAKANRPYSKIICP